MANIQMKGPYTSEKSGRFLSAVILEKSLYMYGLIYQEMLTIFIHIRFWLHTCKGALNNEQISLTFKYCRYF